LELSTRKIVQQTGLSYPTVLKAVDVIRMAIVANMTDPEDLLSGEIELEPISVAREKAKEDAAHSTKSLYSAFSKEMEFKGRGR